MKICQTQKTMKKQNKYDIIEAGTLKCADILIRELSLLTESATLDLTDIKILIPKREKSKISQEKIRTAEISLTEYMKGWKPEIHNLENESFLLKKDLAKAMKISRPTLNKWLNVFDEPGLKIVHGDIELYRVNQVILKLKGLNL